MSGRLRSNDTLEDDKYIKGGTDDTLVGNIGPNLRYVEVLETVTATNLAVTTTAVEAKVGASPLTDRKLLVVTNLGPQTVYYGTASVTAAAGQPLFKNQTLSLPCTAGLSLFLRAANGTQDIRVAEFA